MTGMLIYCAECRTAYVHDTSRSWAWRPRSLFDLMPDLARCPVGHDLVLAECDISVGSLGVECAFATPVPPPPDTAIFPWARFALNPVAPVQSSLEYPQKTVLLDEWSVVTWRKQQWVATAPWYDGAGHSFATDPFRCTGDVVAPIVSA